jgi:Trk-type K+ transport system membrane component
LFCSISAINNAGFTIFHQSSSLAAFRNDGNAFFTFLVIVELVFGGIGYPLIFDVIEKVKYRKLKQRYKFSLFTKVALLGFVFVSVLGLAFSFGFEYGYHGYSNAHYNDIAHFICSSTNKEFGNAEGFNKA